MRTPVTVIWRDEERTFPGVVIAPGIAVVDLGDEGISLTHIRSGTTIHNCVAHLSDAEQAAHIYWTFFAHIDWTRPGNELAVDQEIVRAVAAMGSTAIPSRHGPHYFVDIEPA